ncbi:hypothetical protein [Bifidobacterium sp.]|jgi:hypothetical protein|uniref:hypothetical protein n=1 Tax=Bifidobacterium sp. TaxID=41200 RepID=UPI0025BC6D13|nr:hypothetical protein [Bifidobacterium sp.]MCH4208719.1 hypothetical protein [Bifidobacterium sp.]MCI1224309.1 hypothetical protein [Bifidobacterium sp.]
MNRKTWIKSAALTAAGIVAAAGMMIGMIVCAVSADADLAHVGMGILLLLTVGGMLSAMVLPGRVSGSGSMPCNPHKEIEV